MNLNKEKLLIYGFQQENDYYKYCEKYDELEIRVFVKETLKVEVYDMDSGDLFLPFTQSVYGAYVGSLKERVSDLKRDIIAKCSSSSIMEELDKYVLTKYGSEKVYPFADSEETFVYKTSERQKWFLLYMRINKQKLGLPETEMCEVINLRLQKEHVSEIIDSVHYFRAYHMNKTYWVSVLLDESVDLECVKGLLDESYECVK